jgi:hypothetical protein
MLYLTVFLFLAATYFGVTGWREKSDDAQNFALCLFVAALGSLLVTFLSYGAMQALV